MRILIAVVFMAILGGQTVMAENFQFDSIDGGTMSMSDWRGQPVLVVNTASQCGFTYQYEALQQLHETYRDKGLVVLAVPSDDFNQELSDAAAVKDFCTVNFGLDVPMTTITKVRGLPVAALAVGCRTNCCSAFTGVFDAAASCASV